MRMIWMVVLGLGLLAAGVVQAEEENIEIVRSDGALSASDADGSNSRKLVVRSKLSSGSVIETGPNGRAVVRVGNAGIVVLGSNSKIEIKRGSSTGNVFRHVTGLIYYAMNKIKRGEKRAEVRLKAATIGVRGTRFLVADIEGRQEVGMRKGNVNIASLQGEFEIHRRQEQAEFEAFQQEAAAAMEQENADFKAFQEEALQEVIEYKREFELGKGRMATFDGKKVQDKPLSKETLSDLGSNEAYASEWLQEISD